MKLSRRYMPHTVTVEPLQGTGAYGEVFGDPFPLQCLALGKRRMVRDGTGAERVSELTLYAEHGKAALVPAGSRVTWGGTVTRVLASTSHDDGGMGAPQHSEVVCE